jgi:hypothetical protein
MVKAVPWVIPQPPLCIITPHDTVSGQSTTLKATTDSTATQYYWDYGDGTPAMAWTNVSNTYNLGAAHTYTGAPGTTFVATVYVKNAGGTVNSGKYFVAVRVDSLDVRVNIAIDKALWRLHLDMSSRSGSGASMVGYWNSGAHTSGGYIGNHAANVTAFLVNGHQPDSDLNNPNPYAETVLRGLNRTLNGLTRRTIPSSITNRRGTFNPDQNGNGYAVYVSADDTYQTGMVMDMIAATGQPDMVAAVGTNGIIGQTFRTIGQDMFDYYAYCQNTSSGTPGGGWRYGCPDGSSDNSVCQWAAVGFMGLRDKFGLTFPPAIPGPGTSPVLLANRDWLNYSFYSGTFGYTDPNYFPWGPSAVTPSGMVQLAMNGLGRGVPGSPTMFDQTENWIRANFTGPLGYYYGLFSFTKSMLHHPGGALSQLCARDGFPSNNLTNCIDWYRDPTLGVATRLVSQQGANGDWWGHNYTGAQYYFETGWATIMLNRTVYSSGLPVAVIDASPTTIINGALVNFTGKNSFHQDPSKQIALWEWDLSGTGSGPFTAIGVNQSNIAIHTDSTTFPHTFPVRLRVTDNTPTPQTAITILNITITNPPFPPTANAGGPYSVCPQPAYLPFYLNGTGSKDGTNGGHSPGNPPNQITKYEWDVLGNGTYPLSGPTLSQPRVDDFYAAAGILGSGATLAINLRVTDNSAASYPPSPNLTATATTQLVLRAATDLLCTKCVSSAQAIGHGAVPGKPAYIALLWVETGAHHYNIFRSTTDNGPYTMIGTVTNTVLNTGKTLAYGDTGPLLPGRTYYYRIAPATAADIETCQSNQASTSGSIPSGR